MKAQQIAEAQQLGIPHFLTANAGQETPGNQFVTANWSAGFDENGLTAGGSVNPISNEYAVELVVVAFTSPNYLQEEQREYYTGCWAQTGGVQTPGGTQMGFIMQSGQFTESDKGKTVSVHLQGWVNFKLFGFEKSVVIS